MKYEVVERFLSINGEGAHAGELAAFIRFKNCNLNCSYCDTSWANQPDAPFTLTDADALCEWVKDSGVRNVTLTGGEPLLQANVKELITKLIEQGNRVEIETNGSVDLRPFMDARSRPVFTMDYKLPSSGMEKAMCVENFALLNAHDSVKFVVGSPEDLERAYEIITAYLTNAPCHIFLSPVFGQIDPARMVEFMQEKWLTQVRLQLQLHKFIWDPEKRGV